MCINAKKSYKMLKRPSKNDTDEDLLRLQEEFLASKSAAAVKLVKKEGESTVSSHGKDQSEVPPEKKGRFQKRPEQNEDGEDLLEKNDEHVSKVLMDIVEHEFHSPSVDLPKKRHGEGFPSVFHNSNLPKGDIGKVKKKKSLFAQQFLKNTTEKIKEPDLDGSGESLKTDLSAPVVRRDMKTSGLVTGDGLKKEVASKEARAIHEENVATLSAMSENQILEEQAKLLQMLDPGMVEFLKKKQSKENFESKENMEMDTSDQHSTPSNITMATPGDSSVNASASTGKQPKNQKSKQPDLPIERSDKWVHMGEVEYDKLEWTKSLAAPHTGDSRTGNSARFDFQGNLVSKDTEIPVHMGLHHHGNDPEQAGYTLDELFQLARSSHMQQRVLALNVLATVIRNARGGKFDGSTSTYVIPSLLDGGLIFVVRWALDDHTDNTMVAAVHLLHSLLVCREDECGLDLTFHWYRGHQLCCLRSGQASEETNPESSEEEQDTDADLVKKDVVQGLMRMSVLERLRFILTRWRPAASVVVEVLEVLTRLARHSAQAAYQITQCAGLLEAIFTHFLPCSWSAVADQSAPVFDVYGHPLPQALKLVRVICGAGRHMAACVLQEHGLMERVVRYVCDEHLPLGRDEARALYLEALRTWQVCVCYGLAVSHYQDVYSVLLKQLQSIPPVDGDSQRYTAVVMLLACFIRAAGSVTVTAAKRGGEDWSGTSPALPAIDWSQVNGLFPPVLTCIQIELSNLTSDCVRPPSDLTYLSALLNFAATYYSEADSQPGYSAVDTLSQLEDLSHSTLLPFLQSHTFSSTLADLRVNSVLLHQVEAVKRGEQPHNLPELGALCGNAAEKCPVLSGTTAVPMLVAITRLLLAVGRLHKGLIHKLYTAVTAHQETLQYVRKVCLWQKKAPLATNYFCKFENQFQFNLVSMCRQCGELSVAGGDATDRQLYHVMSLYLLLHLQRGDEYLAHSLLSNAAFNAHFLQDVAAEKLDLDERLQLEEGKYLTSATTERVEKRNNQLTSDSVTHLTEIRNCYLLSVDGLIHDLHKSRTRFLENPLQTDNLLTGDVSQLLVPVDWPFLPLVKLYNNSLNRESVEQEVSSQAMEKSVVNTLRWLHLMEYWRPGVLDSVSLTLKLSRLLCVFLAGNDLFLNSNVHGYLLSLLKLYCKPAQVNRLNLEEKVPGLASFYDFYIVLLNHFEAVSFGDSLFAGYILLPLQQLHDVKYRRAVWSEHIGALQTLIMPLNQVVIAIERFLTPEETNPELLRLYFQALYSASVTAQRNPLPYLIAVHHINRFFYTQDGKHNKLKEAFIKQTDRCKNKNLKSHLFYYKMYDPEADCGIKLYDELPTNRKELLKLYSITM